jgi:ferritin-like metal-binding protein YciE
MADSAVDLFTRQLQSIYGAEHKALDLLARLGDEVPDQELARVFQRHRSVTQEQIRRLDAIFDRARIEKVKGPCPGLDGLISEFESLAYGEKSTDKVLDIFINGMGIKFEYFEIVAYKELVRYANNASLNWAAMLLHDTLQEERQAADELERLSHSLGQRVTSG